MKEKIQYIIIDFLQSVCIYITYSNKIHGTKQNKSPKIKKYGEKVESYLYWIKWQYILKYHGEQDWISTSSDYEDMIVENLNYKKSKLLFKLLVGF